MAENWKFTVYCDKCHAGQHFEGSSPADCAYKAQHEGWTDYNGKTLCERCQQKCELVVGLKPTEEQINEIISKMPGEYADFYYWGTSNEITRFIILEWERIRGAKK